MPDLSILFTFEVLFLEYFEFYQYSTSVVSSNQILGILEVFNKNVCLFVACEYGWTPFAGHCYFFSERKLDWLSAWVWYRYVYNLGSKLSNEIKAFCEKYNDLLNNHGFEKIMQRKNSSCTCMAFL
jgi:hypothetical protein